MAKWLGLSAIEEYRGIKISDLLVNEAFVVANTSIDNVGVYKVEQNCFNCQYKVEKNLPLHEEVIWKVDTATQYHWRILNKGEYDNFTQDYKRGHLCEMRPTFEEYGVYRLNVGRCFLEQEVPPANIYLPIFLCSSIFLGIGIIYAITKYLIRRKITKCAPLKELQITFSVKESHSMNALYSLRGLLITSLLFLTSGAGGYTTLTNSYNGLTIAKCLFLVYVWSIGFRLPFAIDKVSSNKKSKLTIIGNLFQKSLCLFFLGTTIDLAVHYCPIMKPVDLWCPLQNIAISYFLVGTAYALTMHEFHMESKNIICKAISNFMTLLWCWIIFGVVLAFFITMVSTFVSLNCLGNLDLKDHPMSYLLSESSQNCNNAYTEFINRIFAGDSKKMIDVNGYYGFTDGLLGFMTTLLSCFIGLKFGTIYLLYKQTSDRLKLWTIWTVFFGAGGILFICLTYLLNLNLWPISTVLLLSTLAVTFYIALYSLTEILTFHCVYARCCGVTSLFILCGHLLFSSFVPFRWTVEFKCRFYYLLQSFWIIFAWCFIGMVLLRKFKVSI